MTNPPASRRLFVWIGGLVFAGCTLSLVFFALGTRRGAVDAPETGLTAPAASTLGGLATSVETARADETTIAVYLAYCAQCHGENGDGNGLAARFLYPKPRNFRRGQFRLVTTTNNVPSDADLENVISRGMPGSAMFPFGHLPLSTRQALAALVRQMARAGATERLREMAIESGEEPDPAQVSEEVDRMTTPGPAIQVPNDLPVSNLASIARGKVVYVRACASCHGETGKGDGGQDQKDDDGTPTRPRDFTLGIFKGGRDTLQLYARTALGMSGTPMPASASVLSPTEIGDLVHYIQSLSDPKVALQVEHRRVRLVCQRAERPVGKAISDADWSRVAGALVVASPIWWRPYLPPDLTVQAMHDNESIAVRLSWIDATQNDRPSKPEDFEDMVAIQMHKGQPEPFLGMGAPSSASDIWLWRASWMHLPSDADAMMDDYPFDSAVYTKVASKGPRQRPDFFSSRAAGNLNADRGEKLSATNLAAEGFGTLSMKPSASQVVHARGSWKDGRWTVVFHRPMSVSTEAGQALAAGESISIAFALWDGESNDRNGQKLISIWHDLTLENGKTD